MNEQLNEEIEALDAIYPGAVTKDGGIYRLVVPDESVDIKAQISFPSSYPDEPPHILSANRYEGVLQDVLSTVFVSGQVCVFDFLEALREVLENTTSNDAEEEEENEHIDKPESDASTADIFAGWIESDPILDRKSLFVARAAEVHSAQEAAEKIAKLKLDKRIGKATHNITAWRIDSGGVVTQDCDDDGETAAGGRLLHLLQLTDCWNVVVCVSRWFGGVHLGPDRFKHINSSARDALVQGGFINDSKKKRK